MNNALYTQRRNLFIKREKFESRLMEYLEKLLIYTAVFKRPLPKNVHFDFKIIGNDTHERVRAYYTRLAEDLFKDMKSISEDRLNYINDVLDDLHHTLDEYEEALKEAIHNYNNNNN